MPAATFASEQDFRLSSKHREAAVAVPSDSAVVPAAVSMDKEKSVTTDAPQSFTDVAVPAAEASFDEYPRISSGLKRMVMENETPVTSPTSLILADADVALTDSTMGFWRKK
jgi:hypothetical protein